MDIDDQRTVIKGSTMVKCWENYDKYEIIQETRMREGPGSEKPLRIAKLYIPHWGLTRIQISTRY